MLCAQSRAAVKPDFCHVEMGENPSVKFDLFLGGSLPSHRRPSKLPNEFTFRTRRVFAPDEWMMTFA
jgi:hypothetical protein